MDHITLTGRLSSTFWRWTPGGDKTILRQDLTLKEERVSIMFSVLPNLIQSRLPPLPSIRQTMALPVASRIRTTAASSGASTPLSEAETAMVDMSRRNSHMDLGTAATAFSEAKRVLPRTLNSTTGVDWRSGSQGLELLLNAAEECNAKPKAEYNPGFERRTFVDGVANILEGLPHDLDESETAILRRRLPRGLADTLGSVESRRDIAQPPGSPNLVHGTLRYIMPFILEFLRLLFCWVAWIFYTVAEYERRNKVSDTFFSNGGRLVYRIGNGTAGKVIRGAFDYVVRDGFWPALEEFAEMQKESTGTDLEFEKRRNN